LATGEAYEVPGFLDCLVTGLASIIDGLAGKGTTGIVLSGLTNDEVTTILQGEVVRINSDNSFVRASHTANTALLGLVEDVAGIGAAATGSIRHAGLAVIARLATGLTPTAGDLLYLSTTPGLLTNVDPGTGTPVGEVLDASPYTSPTSPVVVAVLRFRTLDTTGGGGSTPLFTFNETDVSQFATASVGTHSGTLALSAVNGALGRKRLRLDMTSFQGQAFYEIKGLSLPKRYVVHATFHVNNSGPTSSDNTIFLHTTNLVEGMGVGSLFGVQFALDTGGTNYLIEAGARITSGTSTMSGTSSFDADTGSMHQVTIMRSADPNAGDPEFAVHRRNLGSGGQKDDAVGSSMYSHTFAGGWNGLTLNKAGIGMSTSNVRTGQAEISELVILPHPMDL
jgi:hypothetical protein